MGDAVRRPNLNSLTMFEAAARHLNFRAAADELNLTQGAVAQQVRRLEADLGAKLFHRKARGLALTEAGRRYHQSIRRALAIIDEASAKFSPDIGRLTLSVTPSFAAKWLVPRLSKFATQYPDIELQTVASEEIADFRSDGVDVAIRQGRPVSGAGLVYQLLAPLDLCAVCSPSFATTIGPVTDLAAMIDHQLIQDGHSHWDALLEEAGLSATRRMMRFNQTALAMDAAANGQGIALAPRLLIREDVAAHRLGLLWQDERPDQNGYYIVYPEKVAASPARDALIEWIMSEATDIV